MMCSLLLKHNSIAIIYRPPPSQDNELTTATFMSEFSEVLSQCAVTTNELIIRNFNIHLDTSNRTHTLKFGEFLQSSGLQQHVQSNTQIHLFSIISNRYVTEYLDVISSVFSS